MSDQIFTSDITSRIKIHAHYRLRDGARRAGAANELTRIDIIKPGEKDLNTAGPLIFAYQDLLRAAEVDIQRTDTNTGDKGKYQHSLYVNSSDLPKLDAYLRAHKPKSSISPKL